MSAWIQTYSGRKFYPLDPQPEDVCLEDIAHALSLVCRFSGHVRHHYSVAQHSVLVALAVSKATNDERLMAWGLLHDASEAYIADVARPLKQSPEFAAYRAAEKRLQAVICERFGLPVEEPAIVKKADAHLLQVERRDLLPHCIRWDEDMGRPGDLDHDAIRQVTPEQAERYFLTLAANLSPGVLL